MKARTKKLALDVIKFTETIPSRRSTDIIARQLIRSGTSVGANYRAASRARSDAEMVAKLGIVEEEADESQYWLELLIESGYAAAGAAKPIFDEFDEIISITVASRKTLRKRIQAKGNTLR